MVIENPFKFILLTKEDCPNCKMLKQFLDTGLSGKYNKNIFIIQKEVDEEAYNKYVGLYNLMSVPALVHMETGEMAVGFNPSQVLKLLSKEG